MNKYGVISPFQYFFDLEKKMDLFSLKFKGVCYWQLARQGLLKGISVNGVSVAHNYNRSIKNEIIGAISECKRTKKTFELIPSADIIRIRPCVTINTNGILADHQYDFVDLGENKILDLYALGKYDDIPEIVQWSLASAEKKVILWKIKRKLFGSKKIENKQKKIIADFLVKINSYYNTSFQLDYVLSQISFLIFNHKAYVNEYKMIFAKVNPRIIIVYPHYDIHMFAAVDAASQMGIASIEIQHGRINDHEAYWYEDHRKTGKYLPDYLLTFGEWWDEQINMPGWVNVIPVGNVYLEKQVQRFPSKDKKNIVAFSGPQSGHDLSKFMVKVEPELTRLGYHIVYKLHPNEKDIWKENYPWLLNCKNIEVADSGSVYEYISKSRFVIAVNSTTMFEATVYKDKTILIYDNGDIEAMKPLVNSGAARKVSSTDELIKAIAVYDGNINKKVSEFDLWTSDAEKNTRYEIEKILRD